MALTTRGYTKHERRELLFYWLAIIAAFAMWSTQSDAATWTTHRATEGMSVEIPGPPIALETIHRSVFGDISSHRYEARDGGALFSANVSALPRWMVRVAGADRILRRAVEAFLADIGGRAVGFGELRSPLQTGVRLRYQAPGSAGRADFILRGNHLYVFDAALPSAEVPERAERFLRSVRFD